MNRRTSRILFCALVVGLVVRCGPGTIEFTPELDDAAMERIERSWVGSVGKGPIVLNFCEDVAANEANDGNDCQVAHTVRGDGRTVASSENRPSGIGCGGCPFSVSSEVAVTASLPTGQFVVMKGTVRLGDTYEEDPYAGDWGVRLTAPAEGEYPEIVLDARILQSGNLLLSGSSLYSAGLSEGLDDVELESTVAAECGGQ